MACDTEEIFLGLLELSLFGNVLHRKQYHLCFVPLEHYPARVKKHYLITDLPEIMLHLIIVENGVLWNDLFKQPLQLRNIPVSALQVV